MQADNTNFVLMLVGVLSLLLALLLGLVAVNASRKSDRYKRQPAKTANRTSGQFWQQTYHFLAVNRFSRTLLQSIRNRLEIGSAYDERGIRRRSATVFLGTGAAMVFLLVFFALFTKDILLTGIFIVVLGFMTDTVLDVSVARVASRLMRQQLRFHEQLRHRYYEEQSIDSAVEAASETMLEEHAHEIYAQSEKLLDVLAAADTETSFEQYRETAPNKYLKLLAGMCVITREYGDAKVENASVFLMSLGHLSDEIRSELFKRDRLLYALKSLNVLTLLPLFFIQPIQQWAGGSFAPMAKFYQQQIGTVLEIAMVVITLFSYMAVRKLQQFDVLHKEHPGKESWESRLYRRLLHPVVERLKPGETTSDHLHLVTLLKKAVSPLRVEEVVTRKIVFGAIGFLAMLILSFFLQVQTSHRILFEPQMPEGFLGGKLSEEDEAARQKETVLDRSILITLPKDVSEEDLTLAVQQSGEVTDRAIPKTVERIADKHRRLQENIFRWWELLLCFVFFALGWQIPMLSLQFQAKVRAMDMEDEVAQFQTIILMLMHMPRVDVEELLEWMEMFSLHFKEALQTCLSDYNAGAPEALDALRKKIAFEPMSALVGNLMLAATDLPILQAFEELESEKTYSREKRKEMNERTVERKRNLGNTVGFIPLYALIVLYLMIPMVVSSMTEMNVFYQQMSSF